MSDLIEIQCFENDLGSKPKFRIRLPAVPRQGESITLPDAHYVIEHVYWHAHIPLTEAPKGFEYPPTTYYTIKMVVRNKFPELMDY